MIRHSFRQPERPGEHRIGFRQPIVATVHEASGAGHVGHHVEVAETRAAEKLALVCKAIAFADFRRPPAIALIRRGGTVRGGQAISGGDGGVGIRIIANIVRHSTTIIYLGKQMMTLLYAGLPWSRLLSSPPPTQRGRTSEPKLGNMFHYDHPNKLLPS